jgi:hypothetical protein
MNAVTKSSVVFSLEGPAEIKSKLFIDVQWRNFEEALIFEIPSGCRIRQWGALGQRKTLLDGQALLPPQEGGKWSLVLARREGTYEFQYNRQKALLKVHDLYQRRERIYWGLAVALALHLGIVVNHFWPENWTFHRDHAPELAGPEAPAQPELKREDFTRVTLLDERTLQALLRHENPNAMVYKDGSSRVKLDPKLIEWAKNNRGELAELASSRGTLSLEEIKRRMESGKIVKPSFDEMSVASAKTLSAEDELLARKHFRRLDYVYQKFFDEALSREPLFSGRMAYRLQVAPNGRLKILNLEFKDFPRGPALDQFRRQVEGVLAQQTLAERLSGAILQGEQYFRR